MSVHIIFLKGVSLMIISSKEVWIEYIANAISEMNEKKTILVTRGDLIKEEQIPLYKEAVQELKEVIWYLRQGGNTNDAYRHLSMNLFMKYESFFMDLFETNEFPKLFDLFELE